MKEKLEANKKQVIYIIDQAETFSKNLTLIFLLTIRWKIKKPEIAKKVNGKKTTSKIPKLINFWIF